MHIDAFIDQQLKQYLDLAWRRILNLLLDHTANLQSHLDLDSRIKPYRIQLKEVSMKRHTNNLPIPLMK